tara:strand:- start:1140 stop:1331 length:192 start_codon:yes stop_codon:yes gene_type:complete
LRGFELGYNAGFRLGEYGGVPPWFTGHDNDAMAEFYFDQVRHRSAQQSVDEIESDLSGGLKPD